MGQNLNTIDWKDPEEDFSDFGLRSKSRRDRIKESRPKRDQKRFYRADTTDPFKQRSRGKDSKPKNDWHEWE